MLIYSIRRFIRKLIILWVILILFVTYYLYFFVKEYYPVYNKLKNDQIQPSLSDKLKFFSWNSDKISLNVNSKCRNSVQGKYLIADDKGYICKRTLVLLNGCCDSNSSVTKRYYCDGCFADGCCSVYEHCVSCCLNPNKRVLLENIFMKPQAGLQIILSSINDHFELCLAKCRTSSLSVYHENTYRNPLRKYCYSENIWDMTSKLDNIKF